jgi:hypothetical protein
VSVAGIESPEALPFQPPQPQEQQPFHQQVPQHLNNAPAPADSQQPFVPHARQLSYPNQPTTGTPLSNIPERAIHAQPFQPYQQGFQPPTFQPQANYYYPPNGMQAQFSGNVAAPGQFVPMFVQHGQTGQPYLVPGMPTSVPAQAATSGQTQSNMVAHEQNGMVYYYDPSQVYGQPPPADGYAPQAQGYTVPGMGGMMTPSPDGYYYPQVPAGTVYYQPQS